MANFPSSLDSLTNPSATDYLNSPSHAGQHANANDIIEALEAKVGIDGSAVTTSHSFLLAGLGAGISVKAYVDALTRYSNLSLATGQVINGKIVVTVTSNNITLALKGADGNDPSDSNPVYCKIGGVIRSVTAALSVTKNAGTNWCNAGSNELKTQEIDYFAYLGYNATDGVVLGFSRVPFASQYSDFSTTTTNEKYCAISTITNASATDYYNVIGRFAATLSGGAGYTWSVPTFTAINLIQRPIWETRILNYIPTVVTGSGTITTLGAMACTYQLLNMKCCAFISIVITTNGTGAVSFMVTVPFNSLQLSEECYGRESLHTGNVLSGEIGGVVANRVDIQTYNNLYPGGNNYKPCVFAQYRIK
jgi:hypothetical protein